MVDIDRIIQSFVKNRIGGVMVFDEAGELIYEDPRISLSEKSKLSFLDQRPSINEDNMSWEFTDTQKKTYFRIETSSVRMDHQLFQCHLFSDVSDYASLFQDISNYSRQIADIADFQSHIMSRLSQPYESCLADLANFCGGTEAVLYLTLEDDKTFWVRYDGDYYREVLNNTVSTMKMLDGRRFDLVDGWYCFLSDDMQGQHCAVYLKRSRAFNEEYFRNISVYNMIRLYIENCLLRERIISDSEHDSLTGLLNKGKYLSLKEKAFGHPERIAILNMDLNFLKRVNDEEGHEAGDLLLVQAAQSIRAITSGNVMGFRMGGDEFLVVATNVSKDEAEALRSKWQAGLDAANADRERPCVIACGMTYGEGNYDLDALLSEADDLMYENKVAIKAAAGLKPDER